jgi:hypothetical protein
MGAEHCVGADRNPGHDDAVCRYVAVFAQYERAGFVVDDRDGIDGAVGADLNLFLDDDAEFGIDIGKSADIRFRSRGASMLSEAESEPAPACDCRLN